MLLDLRETVRNSKPIKYTLIGLICIPFALVGIGSYFAGRSATPVALVNGEPIDEQVLEGAYRQQRQRLAQMFGGQIPEGFDDETALRSQALDQLVNQRVLADEVAEQRFAVGDETLGRAIRERPEFQTDGQFDAERYRQLLGGASGNQVAAFEAQYRDETALEQFQAGVIDTGFTLESEAMRVDELARQQRTIDALRFDAAAAAETIEVDDAAVEERFDANAESYTFPPRVKLAWIELSADALAESLDVTEEDARDWYEDNRSTFMSAGSRDASHILFAVDDADDDEAVAAARAEADAAAARLAAGESFESLAEELSDDPGSAASGGSLGTIFPGLMVPAFEDAVNTLAAVGDVSDPVVSEFGVHLIKLDALVEESGQGFDEVREQAMAGAARDAADREFFEVREQLGELAFDEPESLDAASEATGLEIQTTDWIDRDTPADDLGPVLSNPAVLTTAFSADVLEDGNNSDPIEVGDRHVLVLRVTDDEGTRPKTLEDVREQLVAEIEAERVEALLTERAETAAAALAAGDAPAALADAEPFASALEGAELERRGDTFDAAAMRALFAAPAPSDSAVSSGVQPLANGDVLAWRLLDVSTPDAASGDEAADGTAAAPPAGPVAGADPRRGSLEFAALIASLRERADVDLEP